MLSLCDYKKTLKRIVYKFITFFLIPFLPGLMDLDPHQNELDPKSCS